MSITWTINDQCMIKLLAKICFCEFSLFGCDLLLKGNTRRSYCVELKSQWDTPCAHWDSNGTQWTNYLGRLFSHHHAPAMNRCDEASDYADSVIHWQWRGVWLGMAWPTYTYSSAHRTHGNQPLVFSAFFSVFQFGFTRYHRRIWFLRSSKPPYPAKPETRKFERVLPLGASC